MPLPLVGIAATVAGTALGEVIRGKLGDDSLQKTVARAKNIARQTGGAMMAQDLIAFTKPANVEPILLMDARASRLDYTQDLLSTILNVWSAYYLQAIQIDNNISGVHVLKRLDKFNPDRSTALAIAGAFESRSDESFMFGLPGMGNQTRVPEGSSLAIRASFEASNNSNANDADDPYDKRRARLEVDYRLDEEFADDEYQKQVRARERKMRLDDDFSDADYEKQRRDKERDYRHHEDNQPFEYEKQRRDRQLREDVEDEYRDRTSKRRDQDYDDEIRRKEKYDNPETRRKRVIEDAHNAREKEKIINEGKRSSEIKDISKMVTDPVNMAVGKLIEVTLSENGQTAKIPVSIRLKSISMPSDVMAQILSVGAFDGSLKTRWRQWRSGEISFWADGVFALDRIEAHRRAVMKDKSGYYEEVYKRQAKNAAAALATGELSVASVSSILLITEQTKRDIERNINRKLTDYRSREDAFSRTLAMLMVVVDPDNDLITIYHRGIELPTQLTVRDIRRVGKGDGPDMNEMLKMFVAGKAPNRF